MVVGFLGWVFVVIIAIFIIGAIIGGIEQGKAADAKRKALGFSAIDALEHGEPNPEIVCPHCQMKGRVLTKPIKKKAGISGAKATGALLTGGVSVLATGLSRKEAVTELHCKNCSSTWHF